MNKITLEEIGVGEIISYSSEEALRAVIQNGYSLRYVKKQTPEICLEAVKENDYALQYVKEQTPEICLEAVNIIKGFMLGAISAGGLIIMLNFL